MTRQSHRIEHDLLGDRSVPAAAYYGVHTLRAAENFPITDIPISIYPELVNALASIKQAAALTNNKLGLLDDERTEAIVQACIEIREGKLHDQFIVDVIQHAILPALTIIVATVGGWVLSMRNAMIGVLGDGLTMTELPTTTGPTVVPTKIASRKFQGGMTTPTPSGW